MLYSSICISLSKVIDVKNVLQKICTCISIFRLYLNNNFNWSSFGRRCCIFKLKILKPFPLSPREYMLSLLTTLLFEKKYYWPFHCLCFHWRNPSTLLPRNRNGGYTCTCWRLLSKCWLFWEAASRDLFMVDTCLSIVVTRLELLALFRCIPSRY